MSIRTMKWHIFNSDNEPLCWDGEALEFDSEQDAKEFLAVAIATDDDPSFYDGTMVAERILYYDGGYLNATNLRIDYNTETLISK